MQFISFTLLVTILMKIYCDFAAIQQFVIEKYIHGKPYLQGDIIPMFTYIGEMQTQDIFKSLHSKVPQIEFDEETKHTIREKINKELKELYQKNECMKSLEICVNFLLQTGGQPNQYLSDYASKTLEIGPDDHLNNREIAVNVQLQHVYSFWVLLDEIIDDKPTDKLDTKYKVKLTDTTKLRQFRDKLNTAQLKMLIMSWKHYILMLSDDSRQNDKTALKDVLGICDLISFGNDSQTLGEVEWFKSFPDNVFMKNCGFAFDFLNEELKKREKEGNK